MALLLTNEDVDHLLEMKDVIACLDDAYKDLANEKAANRHRTDILSATNEHDIYHSFKTMDGCVPRYKTAAVRIGSDVLNWPNIDGAFRRVIIPRAPGKRYVGLVLVFSTETGELQTIFPDGVLQRMRVGATNGLGAKYLSREDSEVYGLIGSGWQAGGQLMAMCSVRPIKKVKVFSTNKDHREAFSKEWNEKLGVEIEPVDSAEKAMTNSDIVGCATNSTVALTNAEFIREGTFVTSVRFNEVDSETFKKSSLTTIHWKDIRPSTIYIGGRDAFPAKSKVDNIDRTDIKLSDFPELYQVISGRIPGRMKPKDITIFCNNVGMGFQFAACGALVYEKARQKGMGMLLPNEWFSETVHP